MVGHGFSSVLAEIDIKTGISDLELWLADYTLSPNLDAANFRPWMALAAEAAVNRRTPHARGLGYLVGIAWRYEAAATGRKAE